VKTNLMKVLIGIVALMMIVAWCW